jgi:hypothetical protein
LKKKSRRHSITGLPRISSICRKNLANVVEGEELRLKQLGPILYGARSALPETAFDAETVDGDAAARRRRVLTMMMNSRKATGIEEPLSPGLNNERRCEQGQLN